jgi:hypothetical protein
MLNLLAQTEGASALVAGRLNRDEKLRFRAPVGATAEEPSELKRLGFVPVKGR